MLQRRPQPRPPFQRRRRRRVGPSQTSTSRASTRDAREYPFQLPALRLRSALRRWLRHLPWLQELPDPVDRLDLAVVGRSERPAAKSALRRRRRYGGGGLFPRHFRAPVVIPPASGPLRWRCRSGMGTTTSRYATGRGANPRQRAGPGGTIPTGALAWRPPAWTACAGSATTARLILFAGSSGEATEVVTEGADMAYHWGIVVDLDGSHGLRGLRRRLPCRGQPCAVVPAGSGDGRTVHWIRIDRYYEGEFPDAKLKYMPVLCQHCDDAPCEPVVRSTPRIPTRKASTSRFTTAASARYCANNCPYTVRFFNWFHRNGRSRSSCSTIPMSPYARWSDGEMLVLHPANQARQAGRGPEGRPVADGT